MRRVPVNSLCTNHHGYRQDARQCWKCQCPIETALQLAEKAFPHRPNPRVGCVLTSPDGEVIIPATPSMRAARTPRSWPCAARAVRPRRGNRTVRWSPVPPRPPGPCYALTPRASGGSWRDRIRWYPAGVCAPVPQASKSNRPGAEEANSMSVFSAAWCGRSLGADEAGCLTDGNCAGQRREPVDHLMRARGRPRAPAPAQC
jgi:hypothetical protein